MVAPHDIRVTCIEFDHSVLVSNALVERIFPDVQRPAEDSILAQLSVRRQTIWHQWGRFLRDTFLPVASPV